ncbi:hypothetical protein GCM10027598_75990 [Amycolatopsis oliviviridis]|uniref:Uncharacterized protein n=1 Tax=Amycolatopsis oliviviridis TaxID=1471590 RepID=A0ABQ3L536_9PSEU|nr:hypothetical protein GCM10017790_05930 [Amycolatopsis oliviviridis]
MQAPQVTGAVAPTWAADVPASGAATAVPEAPVNAAPATSAPTSAKPRTGLLVDLGKTTPPSAGDVRVHVARRAADVTARNTKRASHKPVTQSPAERMVRTYRVVVFNSKIGNTRRAARSSME